MAFSKVGTPVPFQKVSICPHCRAILETEGNCTNCDSRLQETTI